ncbi:MAG TPA: xylulokinase [Acidisarcina sp.]|nr:xylulokinase [Acidisarcina sp.]
MWLLGIDVGTGGTRALIVDERGKVIAAAACEHAPFRSPQPGWAEQDPEDWWHAAQEAISGALAAARVASGNSNQQIDAIGLTGQMHGAVVLDSDGKVLRPALIWCDQRTEAQCDWLHQQLGREHLIELTCNPALPNFTLTKLLWIKDHEPQVFASIRHVLCPKDFVRYRLTGAFAMDVQEASGTLLLDVANRKWSSTVARAAGIPEAWLPQLFESTEVCAHVTPEAASTLGLAQGTPVVAGAGDQGAGAVGMGILMPGSVSATIGTSGVVFAATDRPVRDPRGRLHTFCHAVPGRWHVMGVTQSAGLSLRWFRDTFASDTDYDTLTAMAATVAAGSNGLLWAPYLLGERTPHLDSQATAAFIGVTASHTLAHFARAVLEGVAYSLRDSFTLFADLGIPVKGVRLGGGGARSPLWRSIQASVYNHAAEILAAEEGGAFGAALLAGVGIGVWPTADAACTTTLQVAERVEPDADAVRAYDAGYRIYQRLYPALRSLRDS